MHPCNFWKSNLTLTAFTVVGLATAQPSMAAALYSITDIGTLVGEDYSYATSINNKGIVVGSSGLTNAFLYSNGQLTEIKPLPGDNALAVEDINNAGQVVGNSVNTNNFTGNNALVYSGGTTQTLVGLNDAIPYAINDSGQVVGGAQGIDGFLYNNGTITRIGAETVAYDINNTSQVVGFYGGNSTAFLYDNGRTTYLGTLPGDDYSVAYGINDTGQVVGFSAPSNIDDGRAFLYSSSTGLTNLGRLLPTDTYSVATDINNRGQVVGYSGSNNNFYATSGSSAFLYSNGRLQNLNDLISPDSGFTITAASAINDLGQIVGDGSINGELHAVLLTPVPEPSSMLSTLAFGALGTAWLWKRKLKT